MSASLAWLLRLSHPPRPIRPHVLLLEPKLWSLRYRIGWAVAILAQGSNAVFGCLFCFFSRTGFRSRASVSYRIATMSPKFIRLTQEEIDAMTKEELQNELDEMDVLLRKKLEEHHTPIDGLITEAKRQREEDEEEQQQPAGCTRNGNHREARRR